MIYPSKKIIVGSRESPLAKEQVEIFLNALKKKLIERIKQHKSGSKTNNSHEKTSTKDSTRTNIENNSVSRDEFKESLNYLSELSSQKSKESPYPTSLHTKPKTAKIYNL